MNQWVTVATFDTETDATAACLAIQAGDIPVRIDRRVVMPKISVADVMVPAGRAKEARQLLERPVRLVGGHRLKVVCECGITLTFPSEERGRVQECPHCGAYLDVDD